VIKLTNGLPQTGYVITADNWFTSSELGQTLWKKKIHLVGTVRSNRYGLPKALSKEPLKVVKNLKF
jgi:hypothetical protein